MQNNFDEIMSLNEGDTLNGRRIVHMQKFAGWCRVCLGGGTFVYYGKAHPAQVEANPPKCGQKCWSNSNV